MSSSDGDGPSRTVGATTISDFSTNPLANAPSHALAHPHRDAVEPHVGLTLWRRRNVVLWTIVAAAVIACIYLLVVPRRYTSFAEIYVDQPSAGQATDPAHRDEVLNTQAQLMTSTPVLALALAEPGVADVDALHGVADPIDHLQKNVVAEVEKGREIISISFESRNPVQTATLVNAVAQAYLTYQTRIHYSNSAEILDLLEKQKTRDEDSIADANRQFAGMRDMYGHTDFDGTPNSPIVQQETALSNALTAARLEEVSAKAQYDQALALVGMDQAKLKQIEMPDNAGDMIAASPTQLEQINAEILRLEQELRELERNYLPDHPVVRQVNARIDSLTITYVRAQRQRWLSARSQRYALQTSFDQQQKLAVQQAARADEYNRVKTDMARTEKDLDGVEGRLSEISTNQDAGTLHIQLTQPAVPSSVPSHTAKLLVLGGWLLTGLVVGCGLALMRENLPFGRGPMSRLSAELGSPILGVLPAIEGAGTLATRALQIHLEPNGALAEAVRSISRTMAESGMDDANGRTLLIASMNPVEGRTTLATNLALVMAQSGMKVLLVDANNRSPRLNLIFNLSNPFGLFDVLAGRTDDHPAIHTTNIKNVDVLPCGNIPESCVELLNNETLVDVLGELSDRYDRVLIDSPPLARGVEARILAANSAAAILVTAARPTARRQVNQGLRLLRSVGANVLGLVINEPVSADPKSLSSARAKRAALSMSKTKAFRPVLTLGDEDE